MSRRGSIPTPVVALHLGGGLVVTGLGIGHLIAVLRSSSAGTLVDGVNRLPGLVAVGVAIVVPAVCMVLTAWPLRRQGSLLAPIASAALLATSLIGIAVAYGPAGGPLAPLIAVADLAALGYIAVRGRAAAGAGSP